MSAARGSDFMKTLLTLDGSDVILHDDGHISLVADCDVDADGAPHAYHRIDALGLDTIRNARDPQGNYVGVLTDPHGIPLVQQEGDPAPGFYISTTSYELQDQPRGTQRRYLNSETVPFFVLSPKIIDAVPGIVLGCHGRISYRGRSIAALPGDVGPLYKTGEASIAACRELGIPWNPRTGGEERRIVTFEFWPDVPAVVHGITYALQRYGR